MKPLSLQNKKESGMSLKNFLTIKKLTEEKFTCLQSQSNFLVDYGEKLEREGKTELGQQFITLGLSMYVKIQIK